MITRNVTGKAELLQLMSDLIPATSPLLAAFDRGETITSNPDGTERKKKNDTFIVTVTVNGGAKDN